ncbi:MAG TPA: hypothetical protein VFU59_10545 [Candidatus Eisenbacteria bacterium]|nr:hypothetical protein [Candidatus Eisenbacteria bacterium]
MTGPRRPVSLPVAAVPFLAALLLALAPAPPLAAPRSAAAATAAAAERPPGPDPSLWSTLRPSPEPAPPAAPYILAAGERFSLVRPGGAPGRGRGGARGDSSRAIFFRGVNLGAGAPGHFPGEFAIGYEDYRRWLRFARELHANAIRVYALHPPDFYRALRAENEAHPDSPIWLFQEVWTELPETNDFWTPAYRRAFEREIRMTIDAIHGNALVAARPGHASGRYEHDVSPWLAGWLLGREWEPFAVRETERLNPDSTRYRGALVEVAKGTAMECWLGRVCDVAARYEQRNYGLARAVAFVNWPTLDPMRHPTESERGGGEAEHDEDAYSVDPTRIRPVAAPSRASGFLGTFANYHAYPYYPDFLNLDPGYASFRDRHGACSYAGYLADLKSHTPGMPLLIGEVGVPTSRGIAHLQPQGIHHGGASETEQGRRDVRLLEDIADAGASGALLFALFDEWFKVNWMVQKGEWPRDRDPLWHNLLDPEECYGLIGFDPPPAIRVDGDRADWAAVAPYATAGAAAKGFRPLRALYATSDQTRFYLRVDLESAAAARQLRSIGIAFDVLDPARGDRRLPPPLRATWSRGAEYVLLIEPAAASSNDQDRRAALFGDAATRYSEFARIRRGSEVSFLRAPYRPVANDDGRYLPLLIETNRERVSRSGQFYPAGYLNAGRLAYGREPAPDVAWPGETPGIAYDPNAEWRMDDARRTIEIAIPWGLLGVGDPSSRAIIDDRDGTPEIETTRTPGIALLAWATTTKGARADSLGPAADGARDARPAEVQFLGPAGTTQTNATQLVTVTTPRDQVVVWNGWEMPITTERVKRSARFVREAFEGMEARE